MEDYILVDGYNIINAWPELNTLKEVSFEHARIKLIELLANYQGTSDKQIIVVFDAHQVKDGQGKKEKHLNIEVVYTKKGETADMYIEKIAGHLVEKGNVFVATSDGMEQSVILQRGALRITPKELIEVIKKDYLKNSEYIKNMGCKLGILQQNLPQDIKGVLEKWRRGQA